jgi:hypothetical protein
MEPANAKAIKETNGDPLNSDTTKTTKVENSADPAASPSNPSIKLKALVMARTQRTVKGRPRNQGNWWWPKRTGK